MAKTYSTAYAWKVLLYVKTGDESQKRKKDVENKGYIVIDRVKLLNDLEKCKSANEIFEDFVKRLRKIEEVTHTYRNSYVWNATQVVGFYKDMEQVLPNSNWRHVDNPNKGSFVLNWSWLQMPECRIYLEFLFPSWCAADKKPYLPHFKLLVKITADTEPEDRSEKHAMRLRLMYQHVNAFEKHANGLLHRPKKLRTGRYMTIAEVGCAQLISDPASINIKQISERLRPYEEIVRTYAEMQCR